MPAKLQRNSEVYRKYLEQVSVLYSNRQDIRMYTEMLLSLAAVLVFGIFAIRPTVITITQLYSEIQTKKETVITMGQKIDDLVAAQSLWEQQRVRVSILNQTIPDEPLAEKQIRQIEGIAKRNFVNLTGISTENITLIGISDKNANRRRQDEKEQLPLVESEHFPLKIVAQGNYSSLVSFLTDLENMRRPMFQGDVSISGSRDEDQQRLTVSLDGTVSYLLDDREGAE